MVLAGVGGSTGSRASCLGWTRHTLEEMEINLTYGYLTRGYIILFEEQHSETVTQWKVWLEPIIPSPVGVIGHCNCWFDFTMTHFPLPISPKSSSEWHPGPKHGKFSLGEVLQILLENFQLEDKITRVKKKRKENLRSIFPHGHTHRPLETSVLFTHLAATSMWEYERGKLSGDVTSGPTSDLTGLNAPHCQQRLRKSVHQCVL